MRVAAAVSCPAGSSPECVPVGSDHLFGPLGYVAVGVGSATVSGSGPSAEVDITLDAQGSAVVAATTARVVGSGPAGRLVVDIGGTVLVVPTVEAFAGGSLRLQPPAGVSASELVRRLGG
jgi:hypothetical protein